MIKTTPMLFNSELVRALLAGNKIQTRRPVSTELTETIRCHAGYDDEDEAPVSFVYANAKDDEGDIHAKQWLVYSSEYPEEGVCPLGQCPFGKIGDLIYARETFAVIDMGGLDGANWNEIYKADDERPEPVKWKPSIHMPRDLSRLTLKITNVRVERIQDISEEDSWAEGFEGYDDDVTGGVSGYSQFCEAWKNIYGKSWDLNEWVWVIEFEVIHKNVDLVLAEMEQAA